MKVVPGPDPSDSLRARHGEVRTELVSLVSPPLEALLDIRLVPAPHHGTELQFLH